MDTRKSLRRPAASAPVPFPVPDAGAEVTSGDAVDSTFVPSAEAVERRSRHRIGIGLGLVAVLAVTAVGLMVAWPRLRPRPLDAVESVAKAYLEALVRQDPEAARRLSTIDEPPAIRSVRSFTHDRSRDRSLKGSFAPLSAFHTKLDAEYVFDPDAGRFTPRNAMGIAAETLDALHAAKEDAEKSGLYKKMESGNPDD